MPRPHALYYISNLPFYSILLLLILFTILVLIKIIDVVCGININYGNFLSYIIEPIIYGTIIVTIFLSLFVFLYFLIDLKKSKDLDFAEKKKWRNKFLTIGFFANSFYYDYKYMVNDELFILEGFIRKSRNRMFN